MKAARVGFRSADVLTGAQGALAGAVAATGGGGSVSRLKA
jgi:hypothetical protein